MVNVFRSNKNVHLSNAPKMSIMLFIISLQMIISFNLLMIIVNVALHCTMVSTLTKCLPAIMIGLIGVDANYRVSIQFILNGVVVIVMTDFSEIQEPVNVLT